MEERNIALGEPQSYINGICCRDPDATSTSAQVISSVSLHHWHSLALYESLIINGEGALLVSSSGLAVVTMS